jgi:hypothetical protein
MSWRDMTYDEAVQWENKIEKEQEMSTIGIPKIFHEKIYDVAIAFTPSWAQQIFENWIKNNSKVVYGATKVYEEIYFSGIKNILDTHQALLICIEEIEKKECEHKNPGLDMASRSFWYCKDCGKELKPLTFEVYK